jgi:hypothetical protein
VDDAEHRRCEADAQREGRDGGGGQTGADTKEEGGGAKTPVQAVHVWG